MASGAPLLALKATFVVAVLAALAMPSSGRCPSLGPDTASPPAPALELRVLPDLAPAPGPGPGPAPRIRCSECHARCTTESCRATVDKACSPYCTTSPSCDGCRSRELEKCRACCSSGACSCDCDNTVASACYRDCILPMQQCPDCRRMNLNQCTDNCNSHCATICVQE